MKTALTTLEKIQALAQDTTNNQVLSASPIGNISNLTSINTMSV